MYFISVNSKTSQYSSIISVRIRLFLLLRLYMCSCTEAAGAVNVRLKRYQDMATGDRADNPCIRWAHLIGPQGQILQCILALLILHRSLTYMFQRPHTHTLRLKCTANWYSHGRFHFPSATLLLCVCWCVCWCVCVPVCVCLCLCVALIFLWSLQHDYWCHWPSLAEIT